MLDGSFTIIIYKHPETDKIKSSWGWNEKNAMKPKDIMSSATKDDRICNFYLEKYGAAVGKYGRPIDDYKNDTGVIKEKDIIAVIEITNSIEMGMFMPKTINREATNIYKYFYGDDKVEDHSKFIDVIKKFVIEYNNVL